MAAEVGLQKKRHTPLGLVETADLPEEEWLAYRRRGIGGSDVAAIMGISPFRTARDLYFDKRGIAPFEDNEGNWVAMKMGHFLEDLVAKIYLRRKSRSVPMLCQDCAYFISFRIVVINY